MSSPQSEVFELDIQDNTKRPAVTSEYTKDAANGPTTVKSDSPQIRITVDDSLDEAQTETVPDGAVSDARPTRRYQVALLLAGFSMIFQVFGLNSVYGVFQEFYTSSDSNIEDAQGQDALVSLVGTIAYGLTWAGAVFVNPLITRVENLKIITLSGTVIMSLGLFLASFSSKLWHLFLTQALLYGIGAALLYFPIMSNAPQFFDRHRGFAMGFILSGIGVGGLVLAPVVHFLIYRCGIHWTLRILGIWTLIAMIPVACVVKQPAGFKARRRGGPAPSRLSMTLIKRGVFSAQALGSFLQAAGNIVPLFYMPSYSSSVLAYPSSTGSLLLALNNAVNSVSRIIMGIVADRVGRQNTMIISVLLSAISVLAFWFDATRPRFVAFVVLYGILAGGYNALFPTTIAEVYGMKNYNAVNGVIYFIRGAGAIAGPPIAGAILGSHRRGSVVSGSPSAMESGASLKALKDRYNELVVYDGILLVGATLCVVCVRWCDARDKGAWRWKA